MLRILLTNITKLAHTLPRARLAFAYPAAVRINNSLGYGFAKVSNFSQDEEEVGSLYEEEKVNWSADYAAVMGQYPFHHIPVTLIRTPELLQIDESLKLDLIAFKCLRAKESDLAQAYQILFPQTAMYKPLEEGQGGKQLFSDHFQPRIASFIEAINDRKTALKDSMVAFAVLCNVANRRLGKEMLGKLDEGVIGAEPSGVLLAYYALLLCKHGMDYTHLLDRLLEKLQSPANAVQNRLLMGKVIIANYGLVSELPRRLIEQTILLLADQLKQMSNYEIIFTLRLLYPLQCKEGRQYAVKLQQHLMEMNEQQEGLDFHIPLTLKAIRYSTKMGVGCEPLLKFITGNINRFRLIFQKKNITKGVFFSLLFDKYNKDPSPELVAYLKAYFIETVQGLAAAQEADEAELVRFSKLLIKFISHLGEADQQYIRGQYLTHILPSFNSSTDVLFYSLLVVLRRPFAPLTPAKQHQIQREVEAARKQIVTFFERCCSKDNSGRLLVKTMINEVIEVLYQMSRHGIQLPVQQVPSICSYDFSQKETLNPECVSYFFTYLVKDRRHSSQLIKSALNSLQPTLQHYLRGNRIYSMKTFYVMLDICSRVDFEHQFFYKLVENAIATYLIAHPDFVIVEKDLKFLRDKLVKRGYGSRGFKEMVVGALENPREWRVLRNKYTENEKQFMEKNQAKRKERYNNRDKF